MGVVYVFPSSVVVVLSAVQGLPSVFVASVELTTNALCVIPRSLGEHKLGTVPLQVPALPPQLKNLKT